MRLDSPEKLTHIWGVGSWRQLIFSSRSQVFLAGFSVLPRAWLDRLETSENLPPLASGAETDHLVGQLRELRIAFVRQDFYPDLYCGDPAWPAEQLVRASVRRTGPAGLLVDLRADYWIVAEDPAPECGRWQEKIAHDPVPDAAGHRANRDRIPQNGAWGHRHPFSHYAVPVDQIPWDSYDLVISLDIAVPNRIVAKARRPLWVYFPSDPGTPTAKASLRRPPELFDISLTHGFRRLPVRPLAGRRAIEFPYTFLRQKTWQAVFPRENSPDRHGIMLEHQTERLLSEEQKAKLRHLGPLRFPRGPLTAVADSLNQSRFYFRCGGGPIIGNGLVEAVAAGCLAACRARELVNRSLLCSSALPADVPHGVEILQRLAAASGEECRLRGIQTRALDYFCFHRPAQAIWDAWWQLRGRRIPLPRRGPASRIGR